MEKTITKKAVNMKLEDVICCPECKADLAIHSISLTCSKCKKILRVVSGIPILVDLNSLSKHSVKQISFFENKFINDDAFKISPWQKSYLERFLSNFPDVKGKRVLDCGTGTGYMAVGLAQTGAEVFACDLNLRGLLGLKTISVKLGLDIKILCCSAEELPFHSNTFDYFISNAVLEHLSKEGDAITEIDRVCKEKYAGLMVTAPLSYKYLSFSLLPINYIHDIRIGHLRRYNEKILKSKFKDWNLMKTYYTGHFKNVLKIGLNFFGKFFDEEKIEEEDEMLVALKKGASNIIAMFFK